MPLLSAAALYVGSTPVDRAYVGSTQVWPSGAVPTFASMSPKAGASGTSVTITGTNLTAVTGVTFDGAAATSYTVVNSTTITATVPSHADGATNLVLAATGSHAFAAGAYFYGTPVVTVDSLSVTTGDNAGGTTVTITGTGFIGTTGADRSSVNFAGLDAPISAITSTSITCTTPAHAVGPADVSVARVDTDLITGDPVTTLGGLPAAFTYTASTTPTFSSVSPTSGPTAGGEFVRIAGTNLQSVTGVTFGGVAATSVTVLSSIAITCVTPAHAEATSTVVVTTAGGTASITGAYEYSAYAAISTGADLTLAMTGPTAWHDRTLGRNLTTGDLVVQGGTHFISDFVGQPWMTVGSGRTPNLIYGVHFTGSAEVDMDNTIFRACMFDSQPQNAAGGISHRDTVYDFCAVDIRATGGAYSAGDYQYSMHRSSGRGGSDGIRVNGGSTVQDIAECWIQVQMADWQDHNDGAQNVGGSGQIFIRRSHLDTEPEGGIISGPGIGGPDACVLSSELSIWSDLHLEVTDCWLDGGSTSVATLRPYDGALSERITYRLTGNRFARRASLPIHRGTVNTTPTSQIVWSGNVWDDDGTSIPLA